MSRLRKDLAALEYNERRVASVAVVELELAPGLVLGPETVVVVEDMEERDITCLTLDSTNISRVSASETGSAGSPRIAE